MNMNMNPSVTGKKAIPWISAWGQPYYFQQNQHGVGCKRQATATGDKLDVLLAWRADKTRGSNNYTDTLSKARKDPECGSK
jgi:hypothetical protein